MPEQAAFCPDRGVRDECTHVEKRNGPRSAAQRIQDTDKPSLFDNKEAIQVVWRCREKQTVKQEQPKSPPAAVASYWTGPVEEPSPPPPPPPPVSSPLQATWSSANRPMQAETNVRDVHHDMVPAYYERSPHSI